MTFSESVLAIQNSPWKIQNNRIFKRSAGVLRISTDGAAGRDETGGAASAVEKSEGCMPVGGLQAANMNE
jgi:hypothetical protein